MPSAVIEIEEAKARQVARGDLEMIRAMRRQRTAQVVNITRLKILHAGRFGDSIVESLSHRTTCLQFEDRAQRIKIPVVVDPKGARRVATPRGAFRDLRFGLKVDLV